MKEENIWETSGNHHFLEKLMEIGQSNDLNDLITQLKFCCYVPQLYRGYFFSTKVWVASLLIHHNHDTFISTDSKFSQVFTGCIASS